MLKYRPVIYPVEVNAANGNLIEIKFPGRYQAKDNLLTIPVYECVDLNVEQNTGW